MKNDALDLNSETPSATVAVPEVPASNPVEIKAKPPSGRAPKVEKAKPAPTGEDEGEISDRLPTSLKELKETKGGLVASLYLGGRSRDFIAKELKLAFKVSEAQSVKITRRIIGRVRLYQRIFEIVDIQR